MFITTHKRRAGFIGILVGRTHHVAADFVVNIEEIIDIVNPVVFFVSVKGQELTHVEPFFNLERNVARLIQPSRMCHFQSLLIFVLRTTAMPSSGVCLN